MYTEDRLSCFLPVLCRCCLDVRFWLLLLLVLSGRHTCNVIALKMASSSQHEHSEHNTAKRLNLPRLAIRIPWAAREAPSSCEAPRQIQRRSAIPETSQHSCPSADTLQVREACMHDTHLCERFPTKVVFTDRLHSERKIGIYGLSDALQASGARTDNGCMHNIWHMKELA